MKRIIYIIPFLIFAQITFGQVTVPKQRIVILGTTGGGSGGTNKVDSVKTSSDSLYYWINGTVHFGGLVGSGGGSGSGITKLGNSPFALLKLNDSTYYVDSTVILTKLMAANLYYPASGNPSSFLQSITGFITSGTNVSITGIGTTASPFVINATGSAGSGGISQIKAGFGQTLVNDSTTNNDTTVMQTKLGAAATYLAKADTSAMLSPYIRNISGFIANGTNTYVYGSGTLADPYTINTPAPASGTVTNIATGYGLLGGPITTTGTASADTASAHGLVSKDRLANTRDTLRQKQPIFYNPTDSATEFNSDSLYVNLKLAGAAKDSTGFDDSTLITKLYLTQRLAGITGGGISSGSITWPGTLYTTPTNGTVSGTAITFTPSLASQSAYNVFSRGSGSGAPSFNPLDTNYFAGNWAKYVQAAGKPTIAKAPVIIYYHMGSDLYDSIGITQAGASTNGFLSSADWNKFNSPPTNSSLVIRADSLGSNPTTNFPFSTQKGLYLINYQPAASTSLQQSSPAIYFRGAGNSSNTNPFWYRIYAAGSGGSTALYFQTSTDSSTWTNLANMSNSGVLTMSVGSFSAYVSAPTIFQGTTAQLRGSGELKLGNSSNNLPFAKLQIDDTAKGVLIDRMSSNARIMLGTSAYTIPITTGGTGYTIGAYSTTGGSGTGFTGSIQTVSSGAITSLRIVTAGLGYKVGDVLTIVKAGGSGGTITITQLQGDTGPGLMVYDTTVNKLYTWNVSYHGWKSVSGYIGSYSTTASAQSTFTVTLPENVFTTSYVANMIPTSSLAAAPYYITNQTTTTFDVVFLSPITGSLTFNWSLMQP